MVDILSEGFYFWILQRKLLLQKLNPLKLKCITLTSILKTTKIQKYYFQKFNLVVALLQIIFI